MAFDLNRSVECDSGNGVEESGDKQSLVNREPRTPQPDVNDGCNYVEMALHFENMFEAGSLVEGLKQVYVLYCEYARLKGFSVRKGCQKYFENTTEIRMKVYNCSCDGEPDNKKTAGRLAIYQKQVTRTNCKARLCILRERDGPWRVAIFHKRHNHELVNPAQSYLLRSARQMTLAKKYIVDALCSAGIPISRAFKFMEKESGGAQNVGFIKKDAYDHVQKIKRETKVENRDAAALIKFFINKSNKEPLFFWKVQHDDEGRLMNFFFRDLQSSINYENFGDVLSIDTTYKTNKYEMVCAPFVGVNHHCQNVMFGLAFLSDETTETFEWLFETFLESMYGKEPETIFTDQCQAMMNGIDYAFLSSSHRLCQWHINQNAPSHFGKLNGNREMKAMWHRCMNGCETV